MKHLAAVNKYLWKYRYRFIAGIFFVVASNYFAVLTPEITGYVIDKVQQLLPGAKPHATAQSHDFLVQKIINWVNGMKATNIITICSLTFLVFALLRGLFMFFMRQTIIVMSRHIEFDQKNEVYNHYQKLDTGFFKIHNTGDLMNRIAEDISRVRMYTGPAIMYFINLSSTIAFCLFFMMKESVSLTLYVIIPLPILALTIYYVNTIIHKKSERVQALLSDLTTNAQESYSAIRVIKSFVQEKAMLGFFKKNSEDYRKNTVELAKVESIYFPTVTLMVGLSTLIAIFVGGQYFLEGKIGVGTIVEFVFYINMLTFPVSALGWTASMTQRAAASQKRLNEFLKTEPKITDEKNIQSVTLKGDIIFDNVSFTYPHTGIKALDHFSLTIKEGEKVLVMGRTGSGKSTLSQLLLHYYNPDEGKILIGNKNLSHIPLKDLRQQISYVPQDIFLFSDTITHNISFGLNKNADQSEIEQSAKYASIHNEILSLDKGYETLVGERGVTLSGGQKQRISIARALIKESHITLFDDCLSAVDSKTENEIINHLYNILKDKTAIIITHRIFMGLNFDKIIIIEDGKIIEQGTHEELLFANGYYAELYRLQISEEHSAA